MDMGRGMDLKTGRIPYSQRHQSGMPVPAIAYCRFGNLGCLGAIDRQSMELRNRINLHKQLILILQPGGKINIDRSEHSFLVKNLFTIEYYVKLIIDAQGDKMKLLPLRKP